jgi:uncharacterized repeat protein (TIGR02543 family)
VTLPTAPTKTGYTFAGWNTLANGSGTAFTSSTPVVASITVYAQWTINSYTLTYTAGANGTITGTTPQIISYGGSGITVTAVANTGYHFVNWSDGQTANPRTDTNVTANISVTATFAGNVSGTITITAGTGGTVSLTSVTLTVGTAGITIIATPSAGYHVVGTTVTVNPSYITIQNGATTTPTLQATTSMPQGGTATVVVTFAINTYTITSTAHTGGTVSPLGDTSVASGGSQTYTATPDDVYVFDYFVIDGNFKNPIRDSTYTFSNVTTNHTIDAYFSENGGGMAFYNTQCWR